MNIIKVWVGAVFLPEQTSMDGLGFSIAESVARHRSYHDEYKLVQFAPLGKSVLTLTSCSADMNGKTLKLSKQEYCKVWGEAL